MARPLADQAPLVHYDAHGGFLLDGAALEVLGEVQARAVSGGAVDFHLQGIQAGFGDSGCWDLSVPTNTVQAGINVHCFEYYPKPRGATYNIACTESTGGVNPVCFTNAGCGP
jgi:hypothetical protein